VIELSPASGSVQCLPLCGDSAIDMSYEDCTVTGITLAGDIVRVVAVYLVPDSFMELGNYDHRLILSRWFIAIGNFLVALQSDIINECYCPHPIFNNCCCVVPLNRLESLLKPHKPTVGRIKSHFMLQLYWDLSLQENASKWVSFPPGVVTYPS
jgi:hypothetical protein